MNKSKTTQIRYTPLQEVHLQVMASDLKLSKSEIIRRAIDEYWKKFTENKTEIVIERLKKWHCQA